MKVRELKDWLGDFDQDMEVEIATCGSQDQWYSLVEVEADLNAQGAPVLVLHTD